MNSLYPRDCLRGKQGRRGRRWRGRGRLACRAGGEGISDKLRRDPITEEDSRGISDLMLQ